MKKQNMVRPLSSFLCLFICIVYKLNSSYACELNPQYSYLIFDGSTVLLFKELGLLSDPSIKVLLKRKDFSFKEFKGEYMMASKFLPLKKIRKYTKAIIIYPHSSDIFKLKRTLPGFTFIIHQTRRMDPFVATETVLNNISPYLRGCEKKISQFLLKIKKIRNELSLKKVKNTKDMILFFLGELKDDHRLPHFLMVDDGFVKYFLDQKKIISYPSQLSYVTWSKKVLDSVEKKYKKIYYLGLNSKRLNQKQKPFETRFVYKKINNKNFINAYGPYLLVPGPGQLYFLRDLYRELVAKKII